jgi:hypothetical protein
MEPHDSIEVLRNSISGWISRAEGAMEQAARSKEKGLSYQERFEAACAKLKAGVCPFCGGEMLDTSPLKTFAEELAGMQQYLYQGERFTAECRVCRTYQTTEPKDTAQRWTPENTDPQKKVFAAEVFRVLPDIDEVAREKIGKGWMFRINDVWYANDSDKEALRNGWGMKARGRSA